MNQEERKVYILIHKEISVIYGVTDNPQDAEKLKNSFPNPDPIRVYSAKIDNNCMQLYRSSN